MRNNPKSLSLNRETMIRQLSSVSTWDVCVIGGGASGLGIAVDAASRGFKTVLFEQFDFASGTSSRSTKLVHGGVRYLQQGNIRLVMEALKERGLLIRNAPHLVHHQQFVVPNYKWWEGPFYGIGLKLYDWMAGRLGLGPSEFLSREETLARVPTLDREGLRGSIAYYDGQFDDARLAIDLAKTAAREGAVILNYFAVTGLLKENNSIAGVQATDNISGNRIELRAKTVINATGVYSDFITQLDDPGHEHEIRPSQGIHLVVEKHFLPGTTGIMIPRTDDGRVLFAVPWHNRIVLGTTDTPVRGDTPALLKEPVAQPGEIEFILRHIGRYLARNPELSDVRAVFAGLRPLVNSSSKKTASLSRDHAIRVAPSKLVSILGGKWTTYRKMAEDVVDTLIKNGFLPPAACVTQDRKIAGHDGAAPVADVSLLPDDALKQLVAQAVEEEMCMTVEDFLSRRTRTLLLDAQAAITRAPAVAAMMAEQMNRDQNWVNNQIDIFNTTANNYLPH